MTIAERYYDVSMGRRVVGHESKYRHLHGHNCRIHFTCSAAQLSELERVISFGVIRELLYMWLEEHWDHEMMIYDEDPLLPSLWELVLENLVVMPFDPTVEAMAHYLVETITPVQLAGTDVTLVSCRVREAARCGATYPLPIQYAVATSQQNFLQSPRRGKTDGTRDTLYATLGM